MNTGENQGITTVQIEKFLPVILAAIALVAFKLPLVKIQIIGLGTPITGFDLADQESALYLVPLWAIAVILGFFLARKYNCQ